MTHLKLNKFVNELNSFDIVEKLKREANADPNHYEILTQQLQHAKRKNLHTKPTKLNKYRHKKNKWITNGILKPLQSRGKGKTSTSYADLLYSGRKRNLYTT